MVLGADGARNGRLFKTVSSCPRFDEAYRVRRFRMTMHGRIASSFGSALTKNRRRGAFVLLRNYAASDRGRPRRIHTSPSLPRTALSTSAMVFGNASPKRAA